MKCYDLERLDDYGSYITTGEGDSPGHALESTFPEYDPDIAESWIEMDGSFRAVCGEYKYFAEECDDDT